jgi:two-component system cell cycle response regulator
MMPKMNGLEVCRIVKSSSETFLPIILLTVKDDIDSKVTGLKLGADDYLAKPFNALELQARVASMLRIKLLQDKIVSKRQELEALSVTDEMTGLLNHRAMQQRLRDEFARAQRYNDPLSVIMIDVDYFKRINDTHGHITGDRALEKLSKILKKSVRDIDILARYGGDEFLVILPQTHFAGALAVGERMLRNTHAETLTTETETISLTISVGVAFYPNKNIRTVEELVQFADQALYQAKHEGRDRICLHQHLNYVFQSDNATS